MWSIVDYINTTWLWWSVTIVYALIIFGIIAVVISENRNPVKSLAWVTVLLVVPAVGLVLYVVFGRNIQSKRIISRRNRRRLKRLQQEQTRETPRLRRSQSQLQFIRLANSLQGSVCYEGNDVTIFDDGRSKFEALLRDIASRVLHFR